MALSAKCPVCKSTSFESESGAAPGYRFKLMFIHCASCGAVVSVLPATDAGVVANDVFDAVQELKKQVTGLQGALAVVLGQMNQPRQ